MAQDLNLTTEESSALDQIDAELAGSPVRSKAAALDIGDLCEKYQSIRAALLILVKIVKKIPGIGGKIAAAIEFLMSLADIACPVNP